MYKTKLSGRVASFLGSLLLVLLALSSCANKPSIQAASTVGRDDGSQLENPFRLNYAGYLPLQDKLVVNPAREGLTITLRGIRFL